MAFCVLTVDALTKAFVHVQLSPGGFPFSGWIVFRDFLGIDFYIEHVFNHGAAWGMFSSMQLLLLGVRIAAIGGMIAYMCKESSRSMRLPLMLIVAGAIGNVLDTFVYGHVIDMFHFVFWGYSYPVFNVADSAIFCGVVWLCLHSWGLKRARV